MSLKDINILLIEDDEVDVMNLKRAFNKNNIRFSLSIAHDGMEALEMLRGPENIKLKKLPNIILLDINMPKMNGLEFLRELRADQNLNHISVFVLTTSNEKSDKFEAYKLNVAGYILKPLSFQKFVQAINTLNKYWELTELP